MENDIYHPFQALADVFTVNEKFGDFGGVKFIMSWAYSPSVHKPSAVPQSAISRGVINDFPLYFRDPFGIKADSNRTEFEYELSHSNNWSDPR
jgi:N-acetylornithine carbamoyltransferase